MTGTRIHNNGLTLTNAASRLFADCVVGWHFTKVKWRKKQRWQF